MNGQRGCRYEVWKMVSGKQLGSDGEGRSCASLQPHTVRMHPAGRL